MARFEFAVPKSAVGEQPIVFIWENGGRVRITVASQDEDLTSMPGPVSVSTTSAAAARALSDPPALEAGAWSSGGVDLPARTELFFEYDDEHYDGIVDGGEMSFGRDVRSKSPSGAVMAAIKARTGRDVNVNGWNYVEVTLPGETERTPLASLRSSVLKRTR